jgi:hypothetical protein
MLEQSLLDGSLVGQQQITLEEDGPWVLGAFLP